ncbi:MAG: hypothetical protein ACXWT1_07845 [Methylobacter sp.]
MESATLFPKAKSPNPSSTENPESLTTAMEKKQIYGINKGAGFIGFIKLKVCMDAYVLRGTPKSLPKVPL